MKVENVSMKHVENGMIVSYCEVKASATKGHYDNCIRDYKEEVFTDAEEDKAFERFKALFKSSKKEK